MEPEAKGIIDKIIDWFVAVDKFLLFMGLMVALLVLVMVYSIVDSHYDNVACQSKQGVLLTIEGSTKCVREKGLKELIIDGYR